ncbi:MAG: TIR domain-containing protein [Bacteroidetes bacterium]|nr:TIR domain-containing protein [Bacteroidota bacterium]
MKEKPEAIREIEKIFGFPLVETPENELSIPVFYTESFPGIRPLDIHSPSSPKKGRRGYSVDKTNQVTGLSLDFCPIFLLPDSLWSSVRHIRFLSLKKSHLPDYSFVKDWKELTSLYLTSNNLSNVDFIKDIKGLISLDLSNNRLDNVDFIKDLKGLTSLDLSFNSLNNIDFIKDLNGLTSLYLGYNNLSNIDFIKDLKGITSLDLSSNNLDNVNFIKDLKGLTYLNLSNSGLTNFFFIKDLEGLTSLSLYSNNLSAVDFIKDLKGLTSLDLSDNNLSNIDFINDLKGLTSLELSYNNLSNVDFIIDLKGLNSLDLSYNNLSNVDFIKDMKGLTLLDLSYNNLSNVDFIKDMKGLTSLDLSSNDLSNVDFIKDMKGLTSLDLSSNYLFNVDFIKDLKRLTSLYLRHNNLFNVDFIKDLKGLTSLDLSSNLLNAVDFIKDLKGLTSLNLRSNNLSAVDFIKDLKGLTSLGLSLTKLKDYSFIKDLKGLTSLSLSDNNLSNVDFIKDLKGLTSLDLIKNSIAILPEWITEFQLQIDVDKEFSRHGYIALKDNPLENPPLETIRNGKDYIRRYFEEIREQGLEYVWEAKLLLVGDGGVGKTTLAEKLEERTALLPPPDATTRGIKVRPLHFEFTVPANHKQTDKQQTFTYNVWDFGGQAIYHATHRFFMTERALYLVLNDSRENTTDYNKWLQMIEKFGKESPVFLIDNQREEREVTVGDYGSLRKRFTNILDRIPVNFANMDNRFNTLVNKLHNQLTTLPRSGVPVPKLWKEVRTALPEEKKPYLTCTRFHQICADKGIHDPQQIEDLLVLFHELGTLLHFREDPLLKNYVFHQSQYILDALYMLIDSPLVINGRFDQKVIGQIWKEAQYQPMIDELLALAGHFEILYHSEDTGEWIIPQRLPDTANTLFEPVNVQPSVVYDYSEFMPYGILWQIIARLNWYIKDQSRLWRFGVTLKKGGAVAEIREIYSTNKIEIRLSGTETRDIHTLIAEQFDIIHTRYHNFKVERTVYCTCQTCSGAKSPFSYNFDILIDRLKGHKSDVVCPVSDEKVLLSNMLGFLYSNDYLNKFSRSKHDENEQREEREKAPAPPAIYFSYSWGDENETAESREKIVDELYKSLKESGYNLKRDKMDLGYQQLISKFMEEIGRGNMIVVAISGKYLRSPYCMFELLEIDRISQQDKNKFSERVFPVWAERLPLDDLDFKGELFDFWEKKYQKFDAFIKKYSGKVSQEEYAEFEKIKKINANISRLIAFIKDMNALNKELLAKDGFTAVKERIDSRIGHLSKISK